MIPSVLYSHKSHNKIIILLFSFSNQHLSAFPLLHTSMIKCSKEAEAFIPLEKWLFNLHLPPWEWSAGSKPLGLWQKFISGLDLVPDNLKALLLRCRSCANTMRLHRWSEIYIYIKKTLTNHSITTPSHFLCCLLFPNSYIRYFTFSVDSGSSRLCQRWISASVSPLSLRFASSFSPSCRAWNWERLLTPAACSPKGR